MVITYNRDNRRARNFEVLVDGQRVGEEAFPFDSESRSFDREYALPPALIKGKTRLTIRFQITGTNEIAPVDRHPSDSALSLRPAQGHQRVEPGRSPRRDDTGDRDNTGQCRGNGGEAGDVVGRNAKQERRKRLRTGKRDRKAKDDPGSGGHDALTQNKLNDLAMLGTERGAQTDVARALRDAVRQHTEETDAGNGYGRADSEDAEHRGVSPLARKAREGVTRSTWTLNGIAIGGYAASWCSWHRHRGLRAHPVLLRHSKKRAVGDSAANSRGTAFTRFGSHGPDDSRICPRQRFEQHTLRHAEQRRRQANAECHGQDGDRAKAGS